MKPPFLQGLLAVFMLLMISESGFGQAVYVYDHWNNGDSSYFGWTYYPIPPENYDRLSIEGKYRAWESWWEPTPWYTTAYDHADPITVEIHHRGRFVHFLEEYIDMYSIMKWTWDGESYYWKSRTVRVYPSGGAPAPLAPGVTTVQIAPSSTNWPGNENGANPPETE